MCRKAGEPVLAGSGRSSPVKADARASGCELSGFRVRARAQLMLHAITNEPARNRVANDLRRKDVSIARCERSLGFGTDHGVLRYIGTQRTWTTTNHCILAVEREIAFVAIAVVSVVSPPK